LLMNEINFMQTALAEARDAFYRGEIPVGAVRHAEIIAIERACARIGSERLTGCDLYVTKEPCAMCAGAIVHSRIRRLVIGARDGRYGACGSVLSVCGNRSLNHVPEIEFGILEQDAAELLKEFFSLRRNGKNS